MTYASVGDFLKAIADFNKVAQKLNATYVYDKTTGLDSLEKWPTPAKDGVMTTFLRKQNAVSYAAEVSGKVIGFEEATASATG